MTHEVVRGTPFAVDGRVFVPEARIRTVVSREVVIGASTSRAIGFHMRRIRPTALIEQTPNGERRYPIENATARILFKYALIAIAPMILSIILSVLLGRFSARKR
jgi:hypothetical protein